MFEGGRLGLEQRVDVALPGSPAEAGMLQALVRAGCSSAGDTPRGERSVAHADSSDTSAVGSWNDTAFSGQEGGHRDSDLPWSALHPLAARLDGWAPTPDLTEVLTSLEPADLDDAALVEAVAAWERVMSRATSAQAVVIAELRRRRLVEGRDQYVGDEIAARLATTRAAAEMKVGLAVLLDRFPAVADALSAGRIDTRKAVVITEEVMPLPDGAAHDLVDAVLPHAEDMTAPRIRSRIRRLEIARDPGAAQERHVRSRADRHVTLSPTGDAMAWLTAYLPADEAVAVYTSLTALADGAAPDDPRPVDARRADALVDLATRWLDAGVGPDGPLVTRQRRHPHLNVTASASTLLGLDDLPAELSGYGPIPADMARRIADRATWRPLLVDGRTGELLARSSSTYRPSTAVAGAVMDRDVTCTFIGCRTPAARCELDHVVPYDAALPAAEQTRVDKMAAACKHHHQAKTHGGWRPARDPDTGAMVWTAPTGHRYTRPPTVVDPRSDVPGARTDRRATGRPVGGEGPGAPPF